MNDHKPTKLEMIRLALKQRCAYEQNYYLHWYEKIWYTLKFVLCALIDRREHLIPFHSQLSLLGWERNVLVAITENETDYWWELWVGYSFRKGWWISVSIEWEDKEI